MTNTLMRFAHLEQRLKWIAFGLGLGSAFCVVFDSQLWAMLLSLPFCLIWIYCAWLRTEKQLKYINLLFAGLYIYGLARYAFIHSA